MSRTPSKSDPKKLREFAIEAARLMFDRKCSDVVLLDVRAHSQVCDFVAIGSGTSHRQMRSIAQELEEVGESLGFPVYRSSRDDGTTWIVVDFVELVVHLFEPDQRLYYDLELLWANAPRVEWRRPSAAAKTPAAKSPAPSAPVKPAAKVAAKPATRGLSKSTKKSAAKPAGKSTGKTPRRQSLKRSTNRGE